MRLAALVLDQRAQPRAALNWTIIGEYADEVRAGAPFPAVVAFGTEDRAWVGDGWHRTHAHIQAEVDEIEVDLRPGGLTEAVWYSIGANAAHGLRRTNDDKRRAVTRALELAPDMSDSAIARHCGVHHSTVATVRSALEATCEISKSEERLGADGRIINTANIGQLRRVETCDECHRSFEGGHFCTARMLAPAEPIRDIDGASYQTLSLDDAEITEEEIIEASGGDEGGRVRVARIRAAYSAGVRATLELTALRPDSVAEVLAPHQIVVARSFARDVRDWCDRLESALDRGVRLVGTERVHG
jgi:hypothetical protein